MQTKMLGGRVPVELHELALASADLNELSFAAWLTQVVEKNVHPGAPEYVAAKKRLFSAYGVRNDGQESNGEVLTHSH